MRTINQDIPGTINRLKQMRGSSYIIKVNRGRNRIETIEGVIESVYPAIFTVRSEAGELSSFSYADLFSRNISFRAKQS